MLTTVTLYGPLGREFGQNWNLAVSSPAEALRLIEANRPGVRNWIRGNLGNYDRYKVIVDYHDGKKEHLDADTFRLSRSVKRIRFVPIVAGAGGGIGKIIMGVVMMVIGFVSGNPLLFAAGAASMIGGIIELISPRPKKKDGKKEDDGTSYFFDGPVNTTEQGVPVPLIYGRVLVGSHAISAKVSVDQLL